MKCKYCGSEISESDLFCTECGKEVEKNDFNISDDPVPKKKLSVSKILAIALGAFCAILTVVTICISVELSDESYYSDYYFQKWQEAEDELERTQDGALLEFLDSDIAVKITGFSNTDKDSNLISNTLKSSNMRYFMIHYEIKWLVKNPDSTLYISIYEPDGTLKYNSSTSPSGYTFETDISEGTHKSGWGNSTKSTYDSGYYTVLFTYENKVVAAERVYIS